MATVYSTRRVNRIVSHLPGVRAAVAEEALEIGVRAEAKLLRHRDRTNRTDHSVDVSQGRIDSYVSLVGPAPLSVEFGHWYKGNLGGTPQYVPGLYIITGAAGLLG